MYAFCSSIFGLTVLNKTDFHRHLACASLPASFAT